MLQFGFKVGENVLAQVFAANDGDDEFGDTDAYENKVSNAIVKLCYHG